MHNDEIDHEIRAGNAMRRKKLTEYILDFYETDMPGKPKAMV